eukprot:GEMP01017212.1.p1 GENE.GEMP01017212.1~~GEMP01017212.1.p1  ORF type:complete len:736 (+),score=149.70 GEMP01017212.1:31-2238(+)
MPGMFDWRDPTDNLRPTLRKAYMYSQPAHRCVPQFPIDSATGSVYASIEKRPDAPLAHPENKMSAQEKTPGNSSAEIARLRDEVVQAKNDLKRSEEGKNFLRQQVIHLQGLVESQGDATSVDPLKKAGESVSLKFEFLKLQNEFATQRKEWADKVQALEDELARSNGGNDAFFNNHTLSLGRAGNDGANDPSHPSTNGRSVHNNNNAMDRTAYDCDDSTHGISDVATESTFHRATRPFPSGPSASFASKRFAFPRPGSAISNSHGSNWPAMVSEWTQLPTRISSAASTTRSPDAQSFIAPTRFGTISSIPPTRLGTISSIPPTQYDAMSSSIPPTRFDAMSYVLPSRSHLSDDAMSSVTRGPLTRYNMGGGAASTVLRPADSSSSVAPSSIGYGNAAKWPWVDNGHSGVATLNNGGDSTGSHHPLRNTAPAISCRALIIGADYCNQPGSLNACSSDAQQWARLFQRMAKLDPKDIRVLGDSPLMQQRAPLNNFATLDNIMENLDWVFDPNVDIKERFFIFCGHGMQQVAEDFAGTKMCQQGLCPADIWSTRTGDDATPSFRLLTDTEIHQRLIQLPAAVFVTIITDACHAGRPLDRDGYDFLQPFLDRGVTDYEKMNQTPCKPRYLNIPNAQELNMVEPSPRIRLRCSAVHWQACDDAEACVEMPIDEDRPRGVFSYFFVSALVKLGPHSLPQQIQDDIIAQTMRQQRQFPLQQTPRVTLGGTATMSHPFLQPPK